MPADRIVLTNQFLIAMPGMADEAFAGTVVYLCEHNDNGALGLVINKPISLTLGSLFEKVELSPPADGLAESPVFYGGPVQTDRGFVLHEPLDGEGPHYNATLAVPGAIRQRLQHVAAGGHLQAAGQLEEEIGRNGWLTVDASPAIIFDTPVEQRYDKALGLLGIDPRMLSADAGHA